MFTNKMTSRDAAMGRYGHIDMTSGHWPEMHKWIQTLHIPDGMFPSWKVMDIIEQHFRKQDEEKKKGKDKTTKEQGEKNLTWLPPQKVASSGRK